MRRPSAEDVRKTSRSLRARWALRMADHVPLTARTDGWPVVSNDGRLCIGDRVQIVSTIATTEIVVGRDALMEIGDRVFINYGTTISASRQVTIGERTQIGPFCIIMDNSFHHMEPSRRHEIPRSEPVHLGRNVWLGARVIVLPGLTIGDDSVVGAGSVVTGDIPPGVFAAGMPARPVRQL